MLTNQRPKGAVRLYALRFMVYGGPSNAMTVVVETQPSRFVRHTRRCEAEFPVPISDAGACVPHTRTGTCSSGQDAARCTCIHTAVAPDIDPRYPEKNQPPGG